MPHYRLVFEKIVIFSKYSAFPRLFLQVQPLRALRKLPRRWGFPRFLCEIPENNLFQRTRLETVPSEVQGYPFRLPEYALEEGAGIARKACGVQL
jgi:hypothetical protein